MSLATADPLWQARRTSTTCCRASLSDMSRSWQCVVARNETIMLRLGRAIETTKV